MNPPCIQSTSSINPNATSLHIQTILTRQNPQGRDRNYGLRLGEMERDAEISHNLYAFLKERLLGTIDIYNCVEKDN